MPLNRQQLRLSAQATLSLRIKEQQTKRQKAEVILKKQQAEQELQPTPDLKLVPLEIVAQILDFTPMHVEHHYFDKFIYSGQRIENLYGRRKGQGSSAPVLLYRHVAIRNISWLDVFIKGQIPIAVVSVFADVSKGTTLEWEMNKLVASIGSYKQQLVSRGIYTIHLWVARFESHEWWWHTDRTREESDVVYAKVDLRKKLRKQAILRSFTDEHPFMEEAEIFMLGHHTSKTEQKIKAAKAKSKKPKHWD